MKTDSKDKIITNNIINNYSKIYKTDKDPLTLAEDIGIKILSFISKNSLDKFKPGMITSKFLADLHNTPQFAEIKLFVALLQRINLNKIYSNKCKFCFWLNIFNFLVIFSIIYKKEVLTNYYEWYRFLKNSYYNIGGYEISLYEIQNCILTQGKYSQNMYGEEVKFSETDPKSNLYIDSFEKYMIYGISLPTKSSVSLQIYFPSTLSNSLKMNAIEFFAKNINVDLDHNILEVPEYIMWIDPNFPERLDSYKE